MLRTANALSGSTSGAWGGHQGLQRTRVFSQSLDQRAHEMLNRLVSERRRRGYPFHRWIVQVSIGSHVSISSNLPVASTAARQAAASSRAKLSPVARLDRSRS